LFATIISIPVLLDDVRNEIALGIIPNYVILCSNMKSPTDEET
jgi:hypothetical protein